MRNTRHCERPLNRHGDPEREVMDAMKKMPHVKPDLEELQRRGADLERVLGFLVTIVVARSSLRTGKVLRGWENKLRDAAADLNRVGLEAGQLLLDKNSSASYWSTVLGYKIDAQLKWDSLPPTDAFESIESCVRWMEKNADALSHLRSAIRKTQRTGGINELFRYLRRTTGKNHTELVTRLLNAAADALNFNDDFTNEGLKQLRRRHGKRISEQAKEISQVKRMIAEVRFPPERDF